MFKLIAKVNKLKLLFIIFFALLGAAFLTFTSLASAQVSKAPSCGVASLTSGPAPNETEQTGYTYTFHGSYFAGDGLTCTWEITGQPNRVDTPCQDFTQKFPADQLLTVTLTVSDSAGNDICRTVDAKNTFKAGQKRSLIARQLEVSYPTLKGPGGTTLTISTRTTPAQYIRYAFILALTILGAVAFLSILASGAQWLLGQREVAGRRLLGVLTGLVILLASYLILVFINPELVRLKDPELPDIEVINPNVSLRALQICNDARKRGQTLQCKNFSYLGPDACIVNACPDITEGLPCAFSSTFGNVPGLFKFEIAGGGCYSFAKECGTTIKSCGDYLNLGSSIITKYLLGTLGGGQDGKFVCNHDPCHVSSSGCKLTEGSFALITPTTKCEPK